MLPLKVVGFLPQHAGGAIILPLEITTIAGSDFDVDKMYVMMPEFKVSGDKIEKIEYTVIKQISTIVRRLHKSKNRSRTKRYILPRN